MELLKNIEKSRIDSYDKALELFNQGQYAKALGNYFRSLNAAEILKEKDLEAESKKGIILCYSHENEHDEVLTYVDDLLNNYSLEAEQYDLILIVKAYSLSMLGKFRSSEKILKEVITKNESKRVLYRAHTELGLLYYFLHRFSENDTLDDAFNNLKRSYELSEVEGKKSLYMSSANLGMVYLEMNKLDEALKYFEEALEHAENDFYKARTYNELGRVFALKGDLKRSDEYMDQAYRYALENSKLENLAFNIYYRGLIQKHLDKVNNAYSYLHTALYSFIEFKRYPEVVAIYKELHELFKESHPERAEYFLDEYYHFLNYIDPIGE